MVASPMGATAPNSEGGVVLSGSMNWEPVRQRLLGSDLKDALNAAVELREGIEIVHTVEFPLMLSALLPAFSTILAHKTSPSPDLSTIEHKLRNTVLEIISRMPSNEILRPHAPHLVAVALDILNRDYEDNALIASRIIFDLYKVYRSLPQDYVQPYLDYVQNSYRSLPTSVQRNFLFSALAVGPSNETTPSYTSTPTRPATSTETPTQATPSNQSPAISPAKSTPETSTPAVSTTPASAIKTPAKTPPSAAQTPSTSTPMFTPHKVMEKSPSMSKIPVTPVPRLSPKSTSSFRVLTECPLVVMLMFQLYPKFLRGNIPALINVMMEALALRAPPVHSIAQGKQTLDASAKRLYFSRCRELVAAQAKTLSFLTYLLRGFSNDLKPYEDRLASNVVALMSTCPREFISTRKELLVATRHLLNSDFRNGFFRHVDALLDERVLIGAHNRYSEQTVLRPLGYTTLSDLIHHVRAKLNLNQISRVVSIFARVLHDSSRTLPMSTQYTAARTLMSVVDLVFQNKDRNPQIGRDILVRILKTLVEKLSSFHMQWEKASDEEQEKTSLLNRLDIPDGNDAAETLRDFKSMIRAIIVGHKTLIWYINSYRAQREKEKIETMPPRPGSNEEVSSAMLKITHTEHALIDRYIEVAFPCITWLKDSESDKTNASRKSEKSSTSETYRDALTYFAAAFTTLDGYDLRRTLGSRLEKLIEAVTEDSIVLVVPRHLLASNATSSFEFCTLLLNFLVQNIHELSTVSEEGITFLPPAKNCETSELDRLKDYCANHKELPDASRTKRSTAYLQLFERVLKSLSAFPDNEKVLRPHLRRMVSVCLQASMEKSTFKMDNYCMLLRYIFRSISAGKFEESYKELLPLIPTVLNGLYRVFEATDDQFLRQTIIELLLTIPARLSSLLPHLNLLLRVIISALESESGDLVNLGLRTLEFWIDNLNPEFLFPELSKQKELFVSLTRALSTHLRPAPYPYGLLTLRLLGKLGGKNRQVLSEAMDIVDPEQFRQKSLEMIVNFQWLDSERSNQDGFAGGASLQASGGNRLVLPIPLEPCVNTLKRLALMTPVNGAGTTSQQTLTWKDFKKLWDIDIATTDFLPYCCSVMNETRISQAEAATNVLRTAVIKILEEEPTIGHSTDTEVDTNSDSMEGQDMQSAAVSAHSLENDLKLVGFGLMIGCAIEGPSDSLQYVMGMLLHLYSFVVRHEGCFLRIDANGSLIPANDKEDESVGPVKSAEGFFVSGLGSLNPFGYFQLAGTLRNTTNPLAINKSIAEVLSQPQMHVWEKGLEILECLLDFSMEGIPGGIDKPNGLSRGQLVFFESLLGSICEKIASSDWNRRDGLFEGISSLVQKLGREWGLRYEIEIMHAVLFSLKDSPREMSMAGVKAFRFVVRICDTLYGRVLKTDDEIIMDFLSWKPHTSDGVKVNDSVEKEKEGEGNVDNDHKMDSSDGPSIGTPCDEVFQILLTELASTKQILRIASRYVIGHYCIDNHTEEQFNSMFTNHLGLLKRILFSRSLRLLPLPEQVGAVEALALIVDRLPNLIPLSDQHLLAFLSELLKMSSVADGEMKDPNLGGSVVDKNGRAVPAHESSSSAKRAAKSKHYDPPSCALFLRRDCIVITCDKRVHISQELPNAVQLRVSSIHLLRAVIRGHSNSFFDAESSTPIGNIRPHVISLLFRSLVSFPLKSVTASHDALRDVLTLSVVNEGGKSKSRLRKELLQTCIRPVLLNLRDYTRLSVHLLRGLSRLLSLLSSWFNKTLGEKLLDHLQKWADPNRIKAQKIWREGEEPEVAAATIELFVLLPHASHFVEPLVKTTIKLEACLPVFKSRQTSSPFRKPLARYLNKHCQYTVSFFLQRLKTPLYSEMFQDIVKFQESRPLREYLSGRQCSVSILNVCFERPLAIIRSEKKAAGTVGSPPKPFNPKSLFTLHGIHPFRASPTQRELLLKQDLETKRKKLQILQQELARTKELMQSKGGQGTATPTELEDAKRKQKIAKTAFDRGTKEFNETKQKYHAEIAQAKGLSDRSQAQEKGAPRPMSTEALELQNQGFHLIQTLISYDKTYLKEHNDVLRAFRWLWRSKGRYLRLQHEDSVPLRYHSESKYLAIILVDYSRHHPHDVDLLFELIRIFLQATAADFSFVRSFLATAVASLSIEQKKQIIQRFFALLSGESTEEIKTLSMQLVVYPMLQRSFNEKNKKLKHIQESTATTPPLVDEVVAQKLVSDILFKKGKLRQWGDRLKMELLKMTSSLLEHAPATMAPHSEAIIQFCWSQLKSEDVSCKSWAYMVLCRHIDALPSSSKVILQVYGALIRSHQADGRDVVRGALDLLVPSLLRTSNEQNARKAIEYTNRVMFEEVNSMPQLAHIWQTIVDHPSMFYENRHQFVRYMVNSLTRLGLPPNAPSENRVLSVRVVELVLSWCGGDSLQIHDSEAVQSGGKRKAAPTDDISALGKRQKVETGNSSTPRSDDVQTPLSLDQSMIDTMVNFLLRIKVLVADPKLDIGSPQLADKVGELFKEMLTRWQGCNIRTIYLDKVAAMCRDLNISEKFFTNQKITDSKHSPKGKTKTKGLNSNSSKADESRQISPSLLSACMDIFVAVAEIAPGNKFLQCSSHLVDIMTSSFHFARKKEHTALRLKLSQFIRLVIANNSGGRPVDAPVIHKSHVLLERLLIDAQMDYKNKSLQLAQTYEQSRHGTGRPRNSLSQDDKPDEGVANFALGIIQAIAEKDRSMITSFSSSVLDLLTTVVKGHVAIAAAKNKQEGISFVPQMGTCTIRQRHQTSIEGILEGMRPVETSFASTRVVQGKDHFLAKEIEEFSQPLQAAVTIIEVFGKSDIVYSFSKERKILLHSLSTILDTSNSLQLLLITVRVVARWLLMESGGPLTAKERSSFVGKIASFDFNGLSDPVSQPLVDLVSQYVILSFETRKFDPDRFGTEPSGNNEIFLGRSLVACLMTANPTLKKSLHGLFASEKTYSTKQFGEAHNESQRHPPDEILWHLLHSDFEGLGGRNWGVLFVDLLLTTVAPLENDRKSSSLQASTAQKDVNNASLAHTNEVFSALRNDFLSSARLFVDAIRQLVYGDSILMQTYLEIIVPGVWSFIGRTDVQQKMIAPLESLFARTYNSQFLKQQSWNEDRRTLNVVRSFLNAVKMFSPLPMLDANLLVSLAESFNCWYEVLSILEHQYATISKSKQMSVGGEVLSAICHCYRRLGESDLVNTLTLRSCELPQTHCASSLAFYGNIDEAVKVYTDLIELVESDSGPSLKDIEAGVIEESWVKLHREQCQASVVEEFANASEDCSLMLESAWKHREWGKVRNLCSSSELVAAMETGEPTLKLCETLLAVADGKLSDVENLHAQTAQLCLYKWQLLPQLSNASVSHASLLHFFHRLVEIRESGQIMVETSNHSNGKTLPDLKNLLNAWRHRLPNEYDELSLWDEIFTWRSHMFSAITSNFSWSEPSTLATLHDRPWTAIRMSMTARKQGLRDTSLLLLNRLTDNRAMDVSDAYLKLREQILFYNNPDNELERTGGLNLINTTNLSFFDAQQKSELFRLKAIFLSSLRRTSKSNQAYCHSVQICPSHAKAWVSWGGLCSSLGSLTEKQAEQMAAKGGTPEALKDARAASSKKVAQYLAQAMGCYIEAIQIDRSERTRMHLPKCLWILTKDGSSPGVLCQTIENRGTKLPPWVWLPWIPQLLTGLCRIEGRAIKSILTKVVKAYPQAVYYSLRAFYLERRDVERARGISASSTQHLPSVAFAEEMMSTLRRSHASLWSSLEAILEELIVKFRPSYEEELLATISALLERAESHAEKQFLPDKTRLEDEDAMVSSWSKTLSRIAGKFFRDSDTTTGTSRRDERVKKTADFKRKYKVDFEKDFKISSVDNTDASSQPEPKPQFKLSEYITRLQSWKKRLEAQVACTPTRLPLIESSHSLAMFVGETPDLWPGACDTRYLSSTADRHDIDEDETLRNQPSTSSSASIARKAAMSAALSASAAAAREGIGGEYGGGPAAIEIPGQYCPNSSSSADLKPCPEIHAKLRRFEPHVEVLRRNDQLVRRVGMVGSDGRVYRFLLQFAIPYWTRTDERTAQTLFIVDKFLRKDSVCARNHLSVRPCATIPVAQRLRMTLDISSRVSLDEVFRASYDSCEKKLETLPDLFSKRVYEKLRAQTTTDAKKADLESLEKSIRKEVYTTIQSEEVDKNLLLRYVQEHLGSPERLYAFRRTFAGQLAANSLLQYVFSITERTPQRFVLVQSRAQILSPDFRISYSNQGFIENLVVPFRLTPNIQELVGATYIESRFMKGMAMIADAVQKRRDEFDPILRLLMRDDILAWYSKSLAKTDSKTQELERQLIERVSKNVTMLNSRFGECAPTHKREKSEEVIDRRVRELFDEATQADKLAMMPTNYHAWL